MKNNVKNIAMAVKELIAPTAAEFGYLLWNVEYVKEGTRMILRVTIDSDVGITIDDCEKMHRAIDPILDEADPIEGAYYLEVSSPGIERDLRTDEHIRYCEGCKVEVRLYAPVDGVKSFVGILGAFDGATVILQTESTVRNFEKAAVSKIRTVYDFDN